MTSAYYFIIEKDFIWLAQGSTPGISYLPELTLCSITITPYLVCRLNNKNCYVIDKSLIANHLVQDLNSTPFRQAHDLLTPDIFKLAAKAKALLHWLAVHQYCGICGQTTVILSNELARQCSACAELFYPKTSPSVIAVIERGNEMLLARSPRFAPGMYSCIAGFIEPGETAEETLEREVFEEVGLKIKNCRYFASQYWPFPNSFMIGFFAEYASGEIKVDNIEIIDAKWFTKNNLPVLPTHASIARKLIEDWLERH
jgi:NAD+ diphosphatase